MTCDACKHWTVRRVTQYGDGTEIENWRAPDGKGACAVLKIETAPDFECKSFAQEDWNHVDVAMKAGEPWRHFKMIPCPDCNGKGDGGRNHRCAGTGLVRLYDDGYVGDEQTRMHPKEKETAPPPTCTNCGKVVDFEWKHCPACGMKRMTVAETEIVDDSMACLPAAPAFGQRDKVCPLCQLSTWGIAFCANPGCPSGFKPFDASRAPR